MVTPPVPPVAENDPKRQKTVRGSLEELKEEIYQNSFVFFTTKSDGILRMKGISLVNCLMAKLAVGFLDADPCPDGWKRNLLII